jgi:hypothetical protein
MFRQPIEGYREDNALDWGFRSLLGTAVSSGEMFFSGWLQAFISASALSRPSASSRVLYWTKLARMSLGFS